MGDIFIHRRMKECCREALQKLDKICATVSGSSHACKKISLVKELGDLTIDEATFKLENRQNIAERMVLSGQPLTESLGDQGIKAWNETCVRHEHEHRKKSETREAAFWAALRGEVDWLPQHVPVGTASYYSDRYDDFKRRHPDLPPPTYYLNYGKKYYDRFQTIVKPRLSSQGKQWLDKVAKSLQEKMEARIGDTFVTKIAFDSLERNDKLFNEFAYATHCEVYVDAGLWQLSTEDLIMIRATPDWADGYFSMSWYVQAYCAASKDPKAAISTGAAMIVEGLNTVGGAMQDTMNSTVEALP